MIIVSLVQRNLLLYFNNRRRLFFSLLGALISVFLYLLFLGHNLQNVWQRLPHYHQLLDAWLMGGTLVVTAITTTLDVLSQKVADEESHRLANLLMSDAQPGMINLAYVISATLISVVMQMIVYVILSMLFVWQDHFMVVWSHLSLLLIAMVISSVLWTLINFIWVTWIHQRSLVGSLESIIGACAGFMVGVYVPIGSLPTAAQHILKITPGPYNAALLRQILTQYQFTSQHPAINRQFKVFMGLKFNHATTITQNILILLITSGIILVLIILVNVLHKCISRRR
jgi:multidrug/hemolysin transport system permease protein